VGWALGIERLILVLEAAASADIEGTAAKLTSKKAPDIYVVNRGKQVETFALRLVRQFVYLDCPSSSMVLVPPWPSSSSAPIEAVLLGQQ